MKKQMVGEMPWTKILGMVEDLICKLRHGKILPEQLAKFLKNENPFESAKQVVFRGVNALVKEWVKFYKEVFNLDVDFSNLAIPAKRDIFNWLVIMLQGLTAQKLYDKCKDLFHCWKWTDKSLDEVLDQDKSARNPANGIYAIWLRDRVEADEELKNKSAINLQQSNIQGITLEQRLLLELFYYWKTKKHLDIDNVTLCSGSRYYVGYVPGVYWSSILGRLYVDWYFPGTADGHLRSRQAVS
jgi:hypothetical protein